MSMWKYAQIRTLMDEGTIAGYLAITEQRKVKPKIENLSRRMKSHARHGRRQLAEVTVYCRILCVRHGRRSLSDGLEIATITTN